MVNSVFLSENLNCIYNHIYFINDCFNYFINAWIFLGQSITSFYSGIHNLWTVTFHRLSQFTVHQIKQLGCVYTGQNEVRAQMQYLYQNFLRKICHMFGTESTNRSIPIKMFYNHFAYYECCIVRHGLCYKGVNKWWWASSLPPLSKRALDYCLWRFNMIYRKVDLIPWRDYTGLAVTVHRCW